MPKDAWEIIKGGGMEESNDILDEGFRDSLLGMCQSGANTLALAV